MITIITKNQNFLNIHVPGNKQHVSELGERAEDYTSTCQILFVEDEYEARMAEGYEDQVNYTKEQMDEIFAVQHSLERVELGKDPIYLDLCGTFNTREEIELES
eukprot:160766_1